MTSSVGIREAKIHLSHLLRKVRQGIEIIITDRGKPVGKIVPVDSKIISLAERTQNLEIRGIIEEKKSSPKPLPPPLPVEGEIAQKFLQECRK
jgi:prevent-host-death family protein